MNTWTSRKTDHCPLSCKKLFLKAFTKRFKRHVHPLIDVGEN